MKKTASYEKLKIDFPEKYRLLKVWRSMKVIENRTEGKVKRCARWEDFSVFFDDMFPTYTNGASLWRKVPVDGYSPENCYWKEKKQKKVISAGGIEVSLYKAAKITGENYNTIINKVANGKPPLSDEQMRILEEAVTRGGKVR